MSATKIDPKIQGKAIQLASLLDFELSEHNIESYDRLLLEAADQNFDSKNIEFNAISRIFCFQMMSFDKKEKREVLAATALAVAQATKVIVGDLEDYAEVKNGMLARIKRGHEGGITPFNIVYLAYHLKVPISFLVNDYSDKPEQLRKDLTALGLIEIGGCAEVDKNVTQTTIIETAEVETAEVETAEVETAEVETAEVETVEVEAKKEPSEAIWSNDRVAYVDGQEFNLKEKETRYLLAGHIRAACAEAKLSFKAVLEKNDFGKRTTSWLSGIENGKALIYKEELEKLAEVLDKPVSILLTGYGLDPEKMRGRNRVSSSAGNSLVPVGAKVITLPVISDENWNEWFKSRVVSPKAKRAEGLPEGTLKKVLISALNGEHEDEAWESEWLKLTEDGAKFESCVNKVIENTKGWSDVLKSVLLLRLAEAYWQKEDPESG